MRLYRDVNNLPAKNGSAKGTKSQTASSVLNVTAGIEDYQSMSREELLHELMISKINEARLKKGYEVKGDGTVILYGKGNTK